MRLLKNVHDWDQFRRYYKPDLTTRPPTVYPCYVYVSEEFRVRFLLPDDVFKMAMKLRAEIKE